MGFIPLEIPSDKVVLIKSWTVSSTTITKWDALDWDSGYLQRATSASTNIQYVALEDVTTEAAVHNDIEVLRTEWVIFKWETAWDSSAAIRGTFIDLTDHDTLNQAASTTNVFYVENMEWATTDWEVTWFFVRNIA